VGSCALAALALVLACAGDAGAQAGGAAELKRLKGELEKDPASQPVRIAYVRALRLSKAAADLKLARKLIDEVMGDEKKRGWGARSLGMQKENGLLLQEEGKYAKAFDLWQRLVKALARHVKASDALRERYFECYFQMIYCHHKDGSSRKANKEREAAALKTAKEIVKFENDWPDFGGGASQKRFTGLLAAEPALKALYDNLKAPKK
jgi:hypothetical protein